MEQLTSFLEGVFNFHGRGLHWDWTVQVPSALSHRLCLACACVATTISGCETKTRSIALLGLEPAAGLRCCWPCFYCTLQTRWHCTLSLSTLNLPPACFQLPAQLLQLCLAVIAFPLIHILFLVLVTRDLSSCQLVAPLLQNQEAESRQHRGNGFILVLFVPPSHGYTYPVCVWIEDCSSLFQCKVQ